MRKPFPFLVAAVLAMTATVTAFADTYTIKEVRTRCRNQGTNTGVGAVIGGAVGCGLGLALGGNGRSCAVGAGVGAVTGGIIGFASSCEDEVRYVEIWDDALEHRRESRNFERWGDDVSGRIVTTGYHRENGRVCKIYETQTYSGSKVKTRTSVACKERGSWRHGYSRNVVTVREVREESRRERYRDSLDEDIEDYMDDRESDRPRRRRCNSGCNSHNSYPVGGYYYYHYQYHYGY
jgi:hypothetical protein